MASPKFVPQVADTVDVIKNLDLTDSKSKLMVLVLNTRGAEILSGLEQVDCISYPYSISPVFLKKNLNATQEKSFEDVRAILEICRQTRKEAVIYLSMTFGNPYGDEWSMDILRKLTPLTVWLRKCNWSRHKRTNNNTVLMQYFFYQLIFTDRGTILIPRRLM